ncbi:helix-turn-helix transcriptional regulator [Polaribacter porphyrae]|uniref:Transcriptional regulator n=1 Tax=Polaribacter porphyrae TaxID=1137780 RepID=A0A2S7WNX2_9FLAO|nr:helix-turn-helix transcriptional regulator [Polaribacter porphyrae]PQJ78971.1 transcriptional regulator [Polaribacter porphyrae]
MIDAVTIKDVKLQLGKLCKQKRQNYELSQEELALALGLSRYTIQKFENGKNATLDTALKIANHFNLLEKFYKLLKDVENSNNIDSLY